MRSNILLLNLAFLMAILDRGNLGLASLYMQKAIQSSDSEFSFAISVFYFSYVISAMPSLLILRKIGFRNYFTLSLLLWGTITLLIALCYNIEQLIICRVILGVVEAGLVPSILVYLSRYNEKDKLKITNRLFICIPLGLAISGVIGSIAYLPKFSDFNYHLIFLVEGVCSYVIAWLFYYKFNQIIVNIEVRPKIKFKRKYFHPLKQIIIFIAYGLLWVYVYLQLTILLPIILNKIYVITPLSNAHCNLLIGIIAIIIVLVGNKMSNIFNFSASSLLLALCAVLMLISNNLLFVIALAGIELGVLIILISNLFTSINQIIGTEGNKLIGPLTNTTIELGSIITPLLISWILNYSFKGLHNYLNMLAIITLFILAQIINRWYKRSLLD